MRTTVNIDDRLLARAKALAVKTSRPLGDVIDDGLRVLLAQVATGRARSAMDLPTYGAAGVQPGVDLEDKDALAALLDDDPSARRAAG